MNEGALNALVLFSNFVLIPAASYGAQIALGALGVTLIYGVLRFGNFAHGELMAFGTMGVILITWLMQSVGINAGPLPTALLALPFGIVIACVLALLTDKWVYRYYRNQRAASIVFTMVSVGVMFLYSGLTRVVLGPNNQRFMDGEKFIVSAREFKAWSGLKEGLAFKSTQALTLVIAIIVVVALFWFLQRTRTGKAMRAYSDNEDLALLSGIDPNKVVLYAWLIAAALATIAGTLYGLDKSFKPFVYMQLLLPIFAAAIIGGVGHPIGAIVGGFIVAFSEVTITYAFKKFVKYFGAEPEGLVQLLAVEYKFAVSFMILVIVLLVRPTGIFKGQVV